MDDFEILYVGHIAKGEQAGFTMLLSKERFAQLQQYGTRDQAVIFNWLECDTPDPNGPIIRMCIAAYKPLDRGTLIECARSIGRWLYEQGHTGNLYLPD